MSRIRGAMPPSTGSPSTGSPSTGSPSEIEDLWTRLRRAVAKDPHWDDPETDVLADLRAVEMERELPHPACCERAACCLYAYVEMDESSWTPANEGVPVWMISFRIGSRREDDARRELIHVHFCPFCGRKLPALREKKDPPRHLVVPEDGYCSTCGERLRSCFCSYQESAFEVVP